jgi:hypothetical protein
LGGRLMAGERGGTRLGDMQPSFDGGVNTVSDDLALLPNQLRESTNCRLTDFGAVTKRQGTIRTSSAVLAAYSVLNGYTFRRDASTPQILAVCNGALRTATYGAFPWTWATPTATLSTSVPPSFAQFRDGSADVVYIADGGLLNKWDGTTFTGDIASTNDYKVVCVHNERLWGFGSTTTPDSIGYSAINNGSTLGVGASGGGSIIVRTYGDETVVAGCSIGTSLLIFHRRGVSRLTGYGQDDITVAPTGITADVGIIAKYSVVRVDNLAYFICERGLYRVNDSGVAPVATRETPDPLLPLLRSLTSTQFDAIRCEFNRATRELWISIPANGTYVYHTLLNAWAGPWDGGYISPDTTALWETLDANGLPCILKGDSSGWVSRCDVTDSAYDNVAAAGTGGTLFTMTAQLHRFYFGDDALEKSLRWAYMTANLRGSQSCTVSFATEREQGSFVVADEVGYSTWDTGNWDDGRTWGASPTSQSYRVPLGFTGHFANVAISDSSTSIIDISRVQAEAFSIGRR